MRLDSENTLAYHLDLPHRKNYDLGQWPAGFFAAAAGHSKPVSHTKLANPDYDAVEFYALNQMASALQSRFAPEEALPSWANSLLTAYTETLSRQSIYLMHYMILITTRESRHLGGHTSFFAKHADIPDLFKNYFLTYAKTSSEQAQQAFISGAPDIPMGKYTDYILRTFTGSFGSNFGGKPWWNIANALHQFVTGKTSAEIFVDTAYTLAHNNGPIFNKGMYYHMYSGGTLLQILDVQRSGQVAQLVLEGAHSEILAAHGMNVAYNHLKVLLKEAANHMELPSYVDWYKVEDLGSKQKYPSQKAAQIKKYGHPSSPAPKAAAKSVITLVNGKPVKYTGLFEVLPGAFAQIYERVHA